MPSIAFLGKDITDYKANSAKYLEALHFYCPEHGLELTYHAFYVSQLAVANPRLNVKTIAPAQWV